MAQRTFDANTEVVDIDGVTPTATTSTTGVNINGLAVGDKTYLAIFNVSAIAGTVDGSNYWKLQLECSDALGGTYAVVGDVLSITAAGVYEIAFHSEQLNNVTAAADYFRVTATLVGTTATSVTYGCQIAEAY